MTRIQADVRWSAVPEWVSDASLSGLSHAAVRLYAILGRYANSEGGGIFPSRQTLATKMGLSSPRSVDAAKAELVKVGALVYESGKETGTTNRYTLILGRPEQSAAQGWAENCPGGGQDVAHKREPTNDRGGETTSPHAPKLVKVERRNVVFDASARMAGVDVANRRRAAEVAGVTKEIRGYFAAANPELEGERFELACAEEVVRRSRLYRDRMGKGIDLTPSALAKWWHDLDPTTDTREREALDDIDRL